MSNSTRRVQTRKPRGNKTFVKFDTAVPRGARYGSTDRRGNRVDVRDFR